MGPFVYKNAMTFVSLLKEGLRMPENEQMSNMFMCLLNRRVIYCLCTLDRIIFGVFRMLEFLYNMKTSR